MKAKDCINDFIAEQLNCKMPWANYHGKDTLVICQGKEKFQDFRNISRSISFMPLRNQLENKGCLKPNCVTYKWLKEYQSTWAWQTPRNETKLMFPISYNTKTIIRKEIKLADFSTFMVDFGSYLGLYLGASVLSLSEIGLGFFKKLKNLL